MLWLQGWDNAPPVAQACRTSLQAMNPDYRVELLDSTNYVEFIPPDRRWLVGLEDLIPAAAFSDLIRIELLRAHGGVWVDATVVCLRPLDEWLPLMTTSGFFAFRDPGPDRPLSTWFLASEPAHPITSGWADAARLYWSERAEPDEYHWFHYEFRGLVNRDPTFAELWSQVPALEAKIPHHLLPHHRRLQEFPSRVDLGVFSGDTAPVLKLTHKFEPPMPVGSNFEVVVCARTPHIMHCAPPSVASKIAVEVTGDPSILVSTVKKWLRRAGHRVNANNARVTVHVSPTRISVRRSAVPGTVNHFDLDLVDGYVTYVSPNPSRSEGSRFRHWFGRSVEDRSGREFTLRALVSVVERIAGPNT